MNCIICNSIKFVECHHVIKRIYKKTKDLEENGRPLCRNCHKKVEENKDFELSFIKNYVGEESYLKLKELSGKIG